MTLRIDDTLSQISDPRIGNRLEHPLPGLLKLILLGKLCGRVTLKASWRMAKRLPARLLRRLGFSGGKAPCYTTITETLKQLDADDVRLVLATAVRAFGCEDEEAVSIDGKALCGSADDDAPAVKLLAAFCNRLQGVIGEVPVPGGGDEIQAMMDLLDAVDLEGMILTGDAAFTQKKICDKIAKKKADYVFTVKDNQKALKARVKAATEAAEASLSPSGESRHRRSEPV
jgi:predicted transposase YbfD/YdcC